MKLTQFSFLTDENIPFRVVEWLLNKDFDVLDIESNFISIDDDEVMRIAEEQMRVIITQDSDLATILFKKNLKKAGVLYLRPGHVNSSIVISTLEYIFKMDINVVIPFIIVADNQENKIKVRVRLL
jgi:predicted nuclease of predicted toxin-antitoxin system